MLESSGKARERETEQPRPAIDGGRASYSDMLRDTAKNSSDYEHERSVDDIKWNILATTRKSKRKNSFQGRNRHSKIWTASKDTPGLT